MNLTRWLHRIGLIDNKRAAARDGEYQNVFCPHCGEFIPTEYRVLAESSVADESMTFDCSNCGESGAVMNVVDFEPLFESPKSVEVHGRYEIADRQGVEHES